MTFFNTSSCHSRPIAISYSDWLHVKSQAFGGEYDHRSMVITSHNANYGVLTYYVMIDHRRYYRYDGSMTLTLYEALSQVEALLLKGILDDIKSYLLSVGVDAPSWVTASLLENISKVWDGANTDQGRESWIFDGVVRMLAPRCDLTA